MNRVLKNRNVLILWVSRALSRFGDALEGLALMYLVYDLTGSGLAMGTVMLFSAIPNIVVSPIAGAIVDRYNKKVIMFVCEMIRTICLLVIPLLMYFKMISLWQIYLIAFVASTAESFYEPCNGVVFVQLLDKDDLAFANSLVTTTNSIMRVIGFSVAGLVIAYSNKEILFVIDAITFLISAIAAVIIAMPKSEVRNITKPSDILIDIVDAGKYIHSNKVIPVMFFAIFIISSSTIPITSFLPIFTEGQLKLQPSWSGYFMTIFSVGTILGSIIYPILVKLKFKLKRVYLYGFSLIGLLVLLVCSFQNKYVAICMFAIVGIIGSIMMMWGSTEIQKSCDSQYLGRVGAFSSTVMLASTPIVSALCGWAIDEISIISLFQITSVVLILSGLLLYKIVSNKLNIYKDKELEERDMESI